MRPVPLSDLHLHRVRRSDSTDRAGGHEHRAGGSPKQAAGSKNRQPTRKATCPVNQCKRSRCTCRQAACRCRSFRCSTRGPPDRRSVRRERLDLTVHRIDRYSRRRAGRRCRSSRCSSIPWAANRLVARFADAQILRTLHIGWDANTPALWTTGCPFEAKDGRAGVLANGNTDAWAIRSTGCRIALVARVIDTDVAGWTRQPSDPAAGSASVGVLARLKFFAFRVAGSLEGDGRIRPSQEGQQHDAGHARLASVHSA
jgi:hypothetical protein